MAENMDFGSSQEGGGLPLMHLQIDAATAAQLFNVRTENEMLEDETYEDLEFADDDYEPGVKKPTTSSRRTTRSKSKPQAQSLAQKRKTSEKLLKKEIELPIKIDLINLVKQERSLYNLKDPLYMNRIHKDKIWVDISQAMMQKYPDMNTDKCKKMWSAVRESTR